MGFSLMIVEYMSVYFFNKDFEVEVEVITHQSAAYTGGFTLNLHFIYDMHKIIIST